MKSETIVRLAMAGHSNAEISAIVGSRPRRVREVLAAAIKAGMPIAPNGERTASCRAGLAEIRIESCSQLRCGHLSRD